MFIKYTSIDIFRNLNVDIYSLCVYACICVHLHVCICVLYMIHGHIIVNFFFFLSLQRK